MLRYHWKLENILCIALDPGFKRIMGIILLLGEILSLILGKLESMTVLIKLHRFWKVSILLEEKPVQRKTTKNTMFIIMIVT